MAEKKHSGKRKINYPVTTLSFKLGLQLFLRLLLAFLLMDLLLISLIFYHWVDQQEKAAFGESWNMAWKRYPVFLSEKEEDRLKSPTVREHGSLYSEHAQAKMSPLQVALPDQQWHSISFYEKMRYLGWQVDQGEGKISTFAAGHFAYSLVTGATAVLICEMLLLGWQYRRGRRKIEKILLVPLKKMAEEAERLSTSLKSEEVQEEVYHNVESAIVSAEALNPDNAETRIDMGDPNLSGIEDAINTLLSRAQEGTKQQIRFVSDASHELRTPISVIQGYAEMLERWGSTDEAVLRESIEAILAESRQMQILVEQLLFLARGDAGRNPIHMEVLDLAALIKETCDEYTMIDQEHHWSCGFDNDVSDGVEEGINDFEKPGENEAESVQITSLWVQADRQMLKQVLRILSDNARRYSPEGSTIHLQAYRTQAGEPAFYVQDEGCGMSPEELPHIFDRFYRSDPARQREGGGSGLGLAIAKWIVDQHRAHFSVLSRPGLGSRMSVIFPREGVEEQRQRQKLTLN